ncbi:MAG: UDP-N-acetylmuramoyl-tripeptide--D-alanyl-D-alanine ligase [Clostridiales bacterium]|nr:UDP-N-acetylmuramoyl-tripeptide--D-alanyl-D-alanine ligase [Clostridiales bacterium]
MGLIVFNVVYVFCFVVSIVSMSPKLFEYVQLEGYKISSSLKYYLRLPLSLYLLTMLHIVLSIWGYEVGFLDWWVCIIFFALYMFLIVLIFNRDCGVNVVVTKRLIRLIVSYVAIYLLMLLLIFVIDYYWCFVLFVPFAIVAPVDMMIALVVNIPLEKLIGYYYINKARKKLRDARNLIRVGITGSFGKTSVKEILSSILSEVYSILVTPKSFNTPFGITKTINANLNNHHEIFIAEMGAKARGEILELCNLVRPDIGIVTSVGRQHTNTFGGVEGVYFAKKELPDYLHNKSCVFNLTNKYVFSMYREYVGDKWGVYLSLPADVLEKAVIKSSRFSLVYGKYDRSIFYFYPRNNVLSARNIVSSSKGSSFDVWLNGECVVSLSTELLGIHNIINILLAMAVAMKMGVAVDNVIKGVKKVKFINARMQPYYLSSGAVVINNGYNSNIDTARSTLSTLALFDKNRKIVVTPGLIETEDDVTYNRKFGELIAKFATDVIIVKRKNRQAILLGLGNACFDLSRVMCVDSFAAAKSVIDGLNSDSVVLIENDLPDNYK